MYFLLDHFANNGLTYICMALTERELLRILYKY